MSGARAARGTNRRPTVWPWVSRALSAALATLYLVVGDVTVLGECVTVWPSCLWALVLLPRVPWLWMRGARGQAAVSVGFILAFVVSTTEAPSLFRGRAARRPTEGRVFRTVTSNLSRFAVRAVRTER